MAARKTATRPAPLTDIVELDETVLREWASLSQLFTELRDGGPDDDAESPAAAGSLDARDGPLFHRWSVTLHEVTRLTDVTRLCAAVRRRPWCVAVRVITVGPDEVGLFLTTTTRVEGAEINRAVRDVLAQECAAPTTVTVAQDAPPEQP